MFGRRSDGRTVGGGVDPITRLTPYIMPDRVDSMCFCTQYADCEILDSYIRKKHAEGIKLSKMSVILAAYVRAVSQYPEVNRFVVGKKLYSRNELCVSFAMLKINSATDFLETTVKVYFDPTDTVFDVARKIDDTIERNRVVENENKTDKLAHILLSIPGLVNFTVSLLMWMDRRGILPRSIIDASPFHTSLWITNMASIKMNPLHHHIYNFGTSTAFIGLGKKEARTTLKRDGTVEVRNVYPMACTIDERVCAGAIYSMAFQILNDMLRNPEKLEVPPEKVRYDCGVEYHCKEDIIH